MSSEESDTLHEVYSRLTLQERTTATLVEAVDSLKGATRAILDRINALSARGNDWGVLAAWAGVIVLVCSGMSHLAINPLDQRLARLEAELAASRTLHADTARIEERTKWIAMAVGVNIW